MKKLSMVMCLALVLMGGQVMAQQYEVDILPVDGSYDTLVPLEPGEQVSFNVYLTGQIRKLNQSPL